MRRLKVYIYVVSVEREMLERPQCAVLQLYKMCARLKRATVSLLFISHSRSGESPGPACQLYILLLYDNNTIPKFWHQS
jgi:hypothetical protein